MSLLPQYIITQPGGVATFYSYPALMQLTKQAVNSPKYQAWLKRSHLLPIWQEPVLDGKTFPATKMEYIKLYLESSGWVVEEI